MKVKRIIAGLTALAAAGYMMNPAINIMSAVNTVSAGSVDLDYLTTISLYSTVSETYTYGANDMLCNFWTITDSFNYSFTAPQDGTYVICGEFYDPYGSSYIEYVPEYSLEFISEDGIIFGAEINGNAKATLKAGERVVVHAGFINNGFHEEHFADSTRTGGFKLTLNLDKTNTADNTEPLISQAVSGHDLEINGQYGEFLDSNQKVVKYRFTAPVSSEYTFSTAGSNADTYGFMYDESLSECLAKNDKPESDSSECFEITRRIEKNETVFIFVTTYNNSGEGDYRLAVTKGDMDVWPEETNSGIIGNTVTYYVGTTDEPIVSYCWKRYRNGEGWKTISEEETLTFTLTPEMNGDQYYCYVTNAYGQDQSVSFKNIKIPCNVRIKSQSPYFFYYPEGYPVRLFVDAVSETGNTVNYQWQYCDDYSYDYTDIEGESYGSELILNNPSKGNYRCILSDENGVTKTSDRIIIQPVNESDVYTLIPGQESSMYYSFGNYNAPSYFVLNAEQSGKYRITVKDNDYEKSDMNSNVMLFKNKCGDSANNVFSEVNDSNIMEAEIELNKGESALVYFGAHAKFSDASYGVTAAILEEYDDPNTPPAPEDPEIPLPSDEETVVDYTYEGAMLEYTLSDTDEDGEYDTAALDRVIPNGARVISVPDSVNGVRVKVIKTDSFCGLGTNGLNQDFSCVEEINLPYTVEKIEENAVHWCRSLKRIKLDSENCDINPQFIWNGDQNESSAPVVTKFYTMSDCEIYADWLVCINSSRILGDSSGCVYVFHDENYDEPSYLTLVDYNGSAENVTVPSQSYGMPVKEIGEFAFSGQNIKTVTLPETVTSVDYYAFSFCRNLENVIIPSSDCSFKENSFSNERIPYGNTVYNGSVSGHRGSAAEMLAAEYGINFISLDDEQIQVPQSAQAVFKSSYLTLKDGITATFKVEASNDFPEWMSETYVQFTGDTINRKISFYDAKSVTENDKRYYLFSIPVRPDRMTEEITASVHYGTGSEGDNVKFSVKNYLENLKSDERYKEQYTEIADSILNYGAMSQKYTGYRLDDLADKNVNFNGSSNVSLNDRYTAKTENTGSVKAKSATLELGGNTSVCVKFAVPSGENYTVECLNPETGKNAETICSRDGNIVTVTLKDVRPQDLDVMYEFRLTSGGSTAVVKYSAFSYIKTMLEKDNTSRTLKSLLMSLYDYNIAAERLLGETDDESDDDSFSAFPLSDGIVYGSDEGNAPFTEYGDVNGDGVVNQIDSTLGIYYVLGKDMMGYGFNTKAADVTKDGKISLRDAHYIVKYCLYRDVYYDVAPWSDLIPESFEKRNGAVNAEDRRYGMILNNNNLYAEPGEKPEVVLSCELFNNERCNYIRGSFDCPDELSIEFSDDTVASGNDFGAVYSTGTSRTQKAVTLSVPETAKPGEKYKVKYNCIYGTDNAEYYASCEFTIVIPYEYGH